MTTYRLAIMEGDGIGPEVIAATEQVMRAAIGRQSEFAVEFVPLPVGLDAYERFGSTLPEETRAGLESCDGWILGPLTTHIYQDEHGSMPNPSAALRKGYELFANVRPARSFPGVKALYSDVDLIVLRENTEGFYADRNVLDGNGEFRPDADTVISVRVVTRRACRRLARVGFDLARGRRKKVTLIHKANVLRRGDGLFLEECRAVAADYPDVAVDDYHVDAFAMHLVMRPQDFDVIVTTNLFGDVLSDEAAGLIGGLGLAPGLNVGDRFAMAQAVHGSAPDIAGRSIANPTATILSGAMLLEWLAGARDLPEARVVGQQIRQAVDDVLRAGQVRTPDLGGQARTGDFAEAVCRALG